MDLGPYPRRSNDTDTLRIDCWLYGDSETPDFRSVKINKDDIVSWLGSPSPRSNADGKEASAGLRLMCRKTKSADSPPFEDDDKTMRMINMVVGLPESHTYLNMHGAGVCGKYMARTNQPGALQCKELVSVHLH